MRFSSYQAAIEQESSARLQQQWEEDQLQYDDQPSMINS